MIADIIIELALFAIPVFHLIGFTAVALYCLRTRREASSTLLWLMLAWTLPIVGSLLFLTLGVTRIPEKAWHAQRSHDAFGNERRSRESESMPLHYWRRLRDSASISTIGDHVESLARTLNRLQDEFPLLGGNAIEPLVTGDEAFPRMLAAIESAEHHIHIQTYILGNDATGRTFMDLLATKAAQGVQVRLLYDFVGSSSAWLTGFLRRYEDIPHFHIVAWRQMDIFKWRFQINLRNHRKVLIVDGKVAFSGGINLHVANTTHGNVEPIRDYHFVIHGPIVHEIQYTFLRDWHFMTDDDADHLLCEAHFPPITPRADTSIRLVNGGPASEIEALTDVYCACMASAERQLLIVTPYFVPSPDILRGMRLAALRGVEVKLVVPATGNHRTVAHAGQALYEELMQAGIHIYLRPDPLLHAKALVIDGRTALVGTANLDNRSLKLNYETVFAVFDPKFANDLKRIVLDDISMSKRLTPAEWRQRPIRSRVLENICSLLSPML